MREPVVGVEVATQADLRSLRRWVLVAGVWAVAATAVALIALLDTSSSDAERKAENVSDRVEDLERRQDQQGERLDRLETQVEDLAPAADVSKLQDRLARAEKDATQAADRASSANDKITDLEDRVAQLEDEAGSSGTDSGGPATPDTTEPPP